MNTELKNRILNAPTHKPQTPSETGPLLLIEGAPVKNAETFVEARYQLTGFSLLRCYQGVFYRYAGTHWSELRDDMLEHELYAFLANAVIKSKSGKILPFNPTRSKVGEILYALRRSLIIDHKLRPPMFLDESGRSARDLVACENGILHLRTRKLIPQTPAFFNVVCLPWNYDPAAPKPARWLQCLEEAWPDDIESEETLQEVFGYLLTDDTQQQKAFLLVGPKRGGKGTIIHTATQLIGEENVASITLNSLAGEFGRWPLIDKRLAVVPDARLGARANAHAIAEQLLSISGGDQQTINRKHQTFWTGYLGVRFLIATNELPQITDASSTLPSRFIVLQLTESFYGREDTQLKAKLKPEMAGILNWALDGLDRLQKRGKFLMPRSSRAAVREMEDLASPVNAFLREWGEIRKDANILVREFYAAYRTWAVDNGHRVLAKNSFGKTLRALVPRIGTSSSGELRRYVGVGLTENGRETWEECRQTQRK